MAETEPAVRTFLDVGDTVLVRGIIAETMGNYLKIKVPGPGQGFAQYFWVVRSAIVPA